MFGMMGVYALLAEMSLDDLKHLADQLQSHPDPWAVGALKMVECEIAQETRARNKIHTF